MLYSLNYLLTHYLRERVLGHVREVTQHELTCLSLTGAREARDNNGLPQRRVGVRGAAGCVYTPLREPGLTHRDALCMEMRCGDALGGGRGGH